MVLSKPNAYHIGVDTGGTYTDAVIIAAERGQVIASAKAITTKGDLAIGVNEAIASALAANPEMVSARQVSLLSVSTTLATNAVVEGEGSPVAAILAGFDAAMLNRTGIRSVFPDMPIACIGGGHDHNGDEFAPLDLIALEAAIAASADQVEAFAVASAFAVRNPAHELQIREIVAARTGKPVTLSTELSSDLDAPRRALTAVLNARLISRISLLVQAVRSAMEKFGIECPLMVVKGDGTLALAERVALRPIETVLSGPAASLVGAKWLSGRDDFIMCDIGGTTTDLGVLLGGRPKISREGADLGGWRTMVKAIDARAIGLGGDSEVAPQLDGTIAIGPERVVPLALAQARYPEVADMLERELTEPEIISLQGKFVFRPFGAADVSIPRLSAREGEVLAQVTDRPKPVSKVALSSGAQRRESSRER
jgi:N-methylhydantoinase A/oxoprolinase/acetone carboxylase beta subunit